MASLSTTRERLILEGMRQLISHGYEGVGIGPILKAVGVPKGSFYYFFKSKDDYVVAIILAYEEKYRIMRETCFSDASESALARLDRYLIGLESELGEQGSFGGCLYGAIAQTVSGRDDSIRTALSGAFSKWEQSLRELLAIARENGEISAHADIDELAATLVDEYEGALIRVKALGDISAFTRFRTKGVRRLMAMV